MKSLVLSCLCLLLVGRSTAQISFRLVQLPAATLAGATLYLAGSCNNWQAASPAFRFTRLANGQYELMLPTSIREAFSYKITRGSWETVETDATGHDIPNREMLTLAGKDGSATTLAVLNWKDLAAPPKAQACQSTARQPNVQVISAEFVMPQLGRTRRVWVYLPNDYTANTAARYPVLYMHDGQNVFDACTSFSGEWGVDETLNQLQQQGLDAAGCIVVAVDHGGSERLNELSPWKNSEYGGGQGDQYVDFLVQTLKPYIDQHYRTLSGREFTGIAGSSMGGLISTYAALKYPQVYSKVGVFSPAFWFAKDSLFAYLQRHRPPRGSQFYFVSGTTESETMVPLTKAVHDTLARAKVSLQYTTPADGKHAEWFWKREFPAAYQWLYGQQRGANPEPLAYSAHLNPAQNRLEVYLPQGHDRGRIEVLSLEKQVVLTKKVKNRRAVDVRRLPPGSYEVVVSADGKQGRQYLRKP